MTLDATTVNTWAQTVITALTSPLAMIIGISIGGLVIGRARGLF
jgi:hypothetical protein